MDEHEHFLRIAIALADAAVEHGNSPFGALLVKDGEIVLRAENRVVTEGDSTAHAELNLIRMAGTYDREFLAGCTVYASTEPCPMRAAAIGWAGIRTVVYACSAAQMGTVGDAGFDLTCRDVIGSAHHPVTVIGPMLEDEAMRAHRAFWPPFLESIRSSAAQSER
ncbi:MAG: nucleoside deaminase [Anaerolineae bacterium]